MSHQVNSKEFEEKKEKLFKQNIERIRRKIVVASGKGGVGKSTVSVNIAYGLALNGYKVGLLDIDVHGPSIAKMVGIENRIIPIEEGGNPKPIEAHNNLFVMTLASMLESPDDPVVWRGPVKNGVIRQFLDEIEWPELDYLIIDSPPGTGDEVLTIFQILGKDTEVIVVSTPQNVSFLDVRKFINFVKKMELNIIGLVENMGSFVCPHCDNVIDIFKSGGADKTSKDFNIEILGNIPIDQNIATSSDVGRPYIYHYAKTKGGVEFSSIVKKIMDKTN